MIEPTLYPKPIITPYLTIIPNRRPVQKLHVGLGHAKNALTYDSSKYGTLWEMIDGEWKLLYTVEKGETWNPPWRQ